VVDTTIVFGGGNALAAYHAGAFEELQAAGIEPDWVIGASAGAVTAAIVAGNPPEQRLPKLKQFWAEAATSSGYDAQDKLRQYHNGWHVAWSALFGRPTIFRHRWPGFWAALPGTPNDVALYDHAPLRKTLGRLIDFDRLNEAAMRYSVSSVDIQTGEEIVFDNRTTRIGPEHILASSAITPGFPPMEIDGRMLCDPGYVNNTPLDIAFKDRGSGDATIIALELFNLRSPRPKSLDAVLERTQDIVFASPTRRAIEALRREYDLLLKLEPDMPSILLLHGVYQTAAHELAMKTLDFSTSSIADRWAAGQSDMKAGLAVLKQAPRAAGLSYLPFEGPGQAATA
jgi:NTE family protein